jgi:hypothetical protein
MKILSLKKLTRIGYYISIFICLFLFLTTSTLKGATQLVMNCGAPQRDATITIQFGCIWQGNISGVQMNIVIPAGITAAQKAQLIVDKLNTNGIGWTFARDGANVVANSPPEAPADAGMWRIVKSDTTGEHDKVVVPPAPGNAPGIFKVDINNPVNPQIVIPTNHGFTITLTNGISASAVSDGIKTADQIQHEIMTMLEAQGIIWTPHINPYDNSITMQSQAFSTGIPIPPGGTGVECSEGWNDYLGGVGLTYFPNLAIPTLSQWGLIILSILILGTGTLYIIRKRGVKIPV